MEFSEFASLIALKSPVASKYCALLIYRNKIISFASNKFKTLKYSPSCIL